MTTTSVAKLTGPAEGFARNIGSALRRIGYRWDAERVAWVRVGAPVRASDIRPTDLAILRRFTSDGVLTIEHAATELVGA